MPEWETIADEIEKQQGTSIIIGSTDSGKTTFARYLIQKIIKSGIRVSFVDSDVGQSSIGLPGTVSMKIFSYEKDYDDFWFDKMFFVGVINPAKDIPLIIDGTKRMTDMSKEGSDVTIIDTSGLITKEAGLKLKVKKIQTIRPKRIIAIQHNHELEHILKLIDAIKIQRIKPSSAVKKRNYAERIQYRNWRFHSYFNKAENVEFLIKTHEVSFYYGGKLTSPKGDEFEKGTLIGLNCDEETIALGIVIELAENSLVFRSPIQSIKNINRIIFSDITVH